MISRATLRRRSKISFVENIRYKDVIRSATGTRANRDMGVLAFGGGPGRVNAQRNCNTKSTNDAASSNLPTVVRVAISHHYFFLQDCTSLFKTVELPNRIFADKAAQPGMVVPRPRVAPIAS